MNDKEVSPDTVIPAECGGPAHRTPGGDLVSEASRHPRATSVIPAQAGILNYYRGILDKIPACAGMTGLRGNDWVTRE